MCDRQAPEFQAALLHANSALQQQARQPRVTIPSFFHKVAEACTGLASDWTLGTCYARPHRKAVGSRG